MRGASARGFEIARNPCRCSRVVPKKADCAVAKVAEEASDLPRGVAMIHGQATPILICAATSRTRAILRGEEGVVVGDRDAIATAQPCRARPLFTLLRVRGQPSLVNFKSSASRLGITSVPLTTSDVYAVFAPPMNAPFARSTLEYIEPLKRQVSGTAGAPFHAYDYSRTTWRKGSTWR
jgi:hypothetical protein